MKIKGMLAGVRTTDTAVLAQGKVDGEVFSIEDLIIIA